MPDSELFARTHVKVLISGLAHTSRPTEISDKTSTNLIVPFHLQLCPAQYVLLCQGAGPLEINKIIIKIITCHPHSPSIYISLLKRNGGRVCGQVWEGYCPKLDKKMH